MPALGYFPPYPQAAKIPSFLHCGLPWRAGGRLLLPHEQEWNL
jgi:hypothetical protein